jgi:preprotein translocase subunit SecG
MGSIEIFILILAVVVCLLLSLIILVQNPKGGGLASGFSGTASVGGVQKTADFLEKSTWYLVVALFVLCLVSARFSTTAVISGGESNSDKQEQVDEEAASEDDVQPLDDDVNLDDLLKEEDANDGAGDTP